MEQEENTLALVQAKIEALQPCVDDLLERFNETRAEFRTIVYSDNPTETPNRKPNIDQKWKWTESGGPLEVWITRDQLNKAVEELLKLSEVIENQSNDQNQLKEINEQINTIYRLVTCRAVWVMNFDQWRSAHNSNPDCLTIVAGVGIISSTLLLLIKAENQILKTAGYTIIALMGLYAVIGAAISPFTKRSKNERVRKRVRALFKDVHKDEEQGVGK